MSEKRYWKSLQLQNGKIISGYDKSPWIVGEWREVPPPPRSCEGLNCCENIIDAMGYVNMEVLAEVEIDGKQITDDDKITAQRMRINHAWKWEKKDSVSMAIYAAELCLEHFEKEYPNDKRPRGAIEAAKRWIENPTEKNRWAAAARSAAWAAESARSAARSARSAANIQKARTTMKKKIHTWIVKRTKELVKIEG